MLSSDKHVWSLMFNIRPLISGASRKCCGARLSSNVRCHTIMKWAIVTAILAPALLASCKGEFPTSPTQYRAAEDAYDSERLKRSLNDIKAWHSEHKTGLTDSLLNGISVPSIEAAFSENECKPTDELKALWSWRNGEKSSVPFVWYHDFLSMEESQSEYKWLLLGYF